MRLHSYSSPMSELEGGPGCGCPPSYLRRTMPEFKGFPAKGHEAQRDVQKVCRGASAGQRALSVSVLTRAGQWGLKSGLGCALSRRRVSQLCGLEGPLHSGRGSQAILHTQTLQRTLRDRWLACMRCLLPLCFVDSTQVGWGWAQEPPSSYPK